MIALATLRKQHQALAAPRPRPRPVRAASCVCGNCQTCRNREWMRAQRAGALEPVRHCRDCSAPLRRTNRSGWCSVCHPGKHNRAFEVARARKTFSHGGGI